MPISRLFLTERLTSAIPLLNSVPSAIQIEEAIDATLADFNRRVRRIKQADLSIVSGTATYTLPADFQSVIRVGGLLDPTMGVIIAAEGIIPIPMTFRDTWTVAGDQITFYPKPTYTLTRKMWYAAKHVINVSANYPDMTSEEAEIVLLGAKAYGLSYQATKQVGTAYSYRMGDVQVDKKGVSEQIGVQHAVAMAQYEAAIKSYVGTLTIQNFIPAWEWRS